MVERCHGGLDEELARRAGRAAGDVLDLSVNLNPYGPPPLLRRAVAAAPIERYPAPQAEPAKRALAAWRATSPERVIVAPGAAELLWQLARWASVRALDRRAAARAARRRWRGVLVVAPAFSELAAAAHHAGLPTYEHRLHPEENFALDERRLRAALRAHRPALLYAASPGNPHGRATANALFARLAEAHPETLVVVDRSFASLSTAHDDDESGSARVVWLRSLTKDLALAGVRVAYAVAPAALVAELERGRPPWSVSAAAQAAACLAPRLAPFVARSRRRLLADRAALAQLLEPLALRPHPSDTLYLLAALPPGRDAATWQRLLLERHGVLVRDARSFGLPTHVRICAGPAASRRRLLRALISERAP